MDVLITVIFGVLAVWILGTAIMVVTVKNIIHAALWLIATFFGVGALYLLLEAEFVGVVQIAIYVGALAILLIVAIMLTPQIADSEGRRLLRRWPLALVVAAALFGLLVAPAVALHPWRTVGAREISQAGAREIGTAFMREYLLPFEVASVLLLVALVGAVVVAMDAPSRRRVLTLAEELAQRRRAAERAPAAVAEPPRVAEASPADDAAAALPTRPDDQPGPDATPPDRPGADAEAPPDRPGAG